MQCEHRKIFLKNDHFSTFCMKELNRGVSMKSFVDTQFEYCPFMWMFHNKNVNTRITHIYKNLYVDNG